MNSEKNIRKGSYIVEAVIIVPVFIIAVIMLMSIVPIIGTCENITFAVADEMRIEGIKSSYRRNSVSVPVITKHRIYKENNNITSFSTVFYRYRYSQNGIDDLISLDVKATFSEKNPMGLFSHVIFQGRVTSRAFTGTVHRELPSSKNEFEENRKSEPVYIFPEWGKKYHSKNCTYVKSNCRLVYLSQDIKKKYKPCKLCDAKNAIIGSPVFCFMVSGDVYHMGNCRTVDKYYIEIEKEEAVNKGYSPCSKCGGG